MHSELGDRVDVAIRGLEVAWHFGNPLAEYTAIRSAAAVMDLSSSPLVGVRGPGATDALGSLFTKELEYLSYENSTLGLFLDEQGDVVEIATVCRRDDEFLIEPGIGGGPALLAHLAEHLDEGVEAFDLSGELGLVSIEGPETWAVAEALLDTPLTGLPFQGVRPTSFRGVEVLGARTGWTGEFGLKFYLPPELVAEFLDAARGRCTEVGHWALELAMLEIRQPVLHRELRDRPSLVEAGWNWLVDLDKDDFLGRDRLEAMSDPGRRTLCFRSGAGVSDDAAVETADQVVGSVAWSMYHPVLDETLGLARLDRAVSASGLTLGVRNDDGELVAARTVSSPMITPTSWGVDNLLLANG